MSLPVGGGVAEDATPDARKPRRWQRGIFGMLALGATLGTALDGIHTHFGATMYAKPVAWRAAWWVPFLFAGAFSLGLLRPLLDAGPPRSRSVALFSMLCFVVAYWATVLRWPVPAISLLLIGVFSIAYVVCDRTPLGLLIALTGSFAGPAFEAALVKAGVFAHLTPFSFGVSFWLPFLYLTAAVALTTTAKWLVDGE